jgi:hypothetical protein
MAANTGPGGKPSGPLSRSQASTSPQRPDVTCRNNEDNAQLFLAWPGLMRVVWYRR